MITNKELSKDKAKYTKQLDLHLALKRLYSNPDFMLVFTKHYCNEYVLSLVSKLNQYNEDSNEHKEILRELSAISYYQKYLDTINLTGAMALDSLNELTAIPDDEISYD